MRRRTLLATIAGTSLAVPGCLGDDPTGQESPEAPSEEPPVDGDTPSPTRTPTPEPDHDVTVESVRHQYGYVSPDSPDSIGIADEEQAYLLVEVDGTDLPPYDDFELAVGDRTSTPDGDAILHRTGWVRERSEFDADGGGWLVFPHDRVAEGIEVTLTWPGGEH